MNGPRESLVLAGVRRFTGQTAAKGKVGKFDGIMYTQTGRAVLIVKFGNVLRAEIVCVIKRILFGASCAQIFNI